ncbi:MULTISPECIES: LysR family transcriptional regulator [unclassified Streptomyces]|uniref:LysR family transcriptional regulator n=1 Tax=Streptomyces TaxID=1883 RepID=UPI00136D7C37|nr:MULTISPECIES: LysR family transcriptional regulator [unclassified Streptomyces]NEA03865.1 LysR family transcriptional regulator [Streptomyces sp. SID10116]MYY80119.1 LysR family transcriptional regulator [Streptomyces sp. SID335]MYZ12441.1 LysR family transcriptional regulator [Streptomyces sp. SID337]NDZ85335.1 LysR family transcriptional regulator [Streptomyces sp. SID10115]NEB46555.1 LysR family transcriptional regulator [Streptomyces sp. SID339]
MPKDLDTALLRSFVTVVRAGSISRAATTLGQTQPALSQQVRKLERAVGRTLLHRSPSGVSLTRAGQELLPYAERILALSAQALSETGRVLSGRCGVGLLEDLAASQLPQTLADLARLHPDALLEVLSMPDTAMREAYETGHVQLVLNEAPALPGPPRWTVRRPLVWAVGQGVDVTADPLPVVLFSNTCSWRTSVLAALERAERPWRVTFESNSLTGVLAALRAGLGVAAVLPTNLEPAMACHDMDALPALPDVELGLARHPRSEGDALIDAVEDALRRTL